MSKAVKGALRLVEAVLMIIGHSGSNRSVFYLHRAPNAAPLIMSMCN